MTVLDPGHVYELRHLDGHGRELLTFVKRDGPGYPGNVGCHAGTNMQEVIRALIDRLKYVDGQIPCDENKLSLSYLRAALWHLEVRAAARHGRILPDLWACDVETRDVCVRCGHVGCEQHKETV